MRRCCTRSTGRSCVAGDYNIIPTDLDVYKPERWADDALMQPEPQAQYRRLLDQGWTDAIRTLFPDERIYTFWDYWRNAFARNAGIRIDHLLLNPAAADAARRSGRRPRCAGPRGHQRPCADLDRAARRMRALASARFTFWPAARREMAVFRHWPRSCSFTNMLKKALRLFVIKNRFEAWAVIYAIALGAMTRGDPISSSSIPAPSAGLSSPPAAAPCSWPAPRSSTEPGARRIAARALRAWSRGPVKAAAENWRKIPTVGVGCRVHPTGPTLHFPRISANPRTWHAPCNSQSNRREGGANRLKGARRCSSSKPSATASSPRCFRSS